MNHELIVPRSRATSAQSEKVYIEFELEPEVLSQVEALARQSHCTPFEMCVKLLKQQVSARRSRVLA